MKQCSKFVEYVFQSVTNSQSYHKSSAQLCHQELVEQFATFLETATSKLPVNILTSPVLITNRKSHMSFPLVPNLVTLDDLERRNSPNRREISPNSVAFGAFQFREYWEMIRWSIKSSSVPHPPSGRLLLIRRNSSGDEIANVKFLYDDIVHALHNTINSYINSATDRRDYVLEHRFNKFSEITHCNGHYDVLGHSRSQILVTVESSYIRLPISD